MVTDKERAQKVVREIENTRSYYFSPSQKSAICKVAEAEFAAVRKERDAEWSAAARKAYRALDLQLNNRYGSYMMTRQGEEEFRNTATEARGALNALIEEVKP